MAGENKEGTITVPMSETGFTEKAEKTLADFKTGFEAFKVAQTEANAAVKAAVEKQSAEATAKAEAAVKRVETLAADLDEIQMKIADNLARGETGKPGSMGQVFVASPEYKAFIDGMHGNFIKPSSGFKLQVQAAITGTEGSPADNSDTLVPTDRRPGIVPGAFRQLRVATLIPTINTTSNLWEFTRELVFTNSAAETEEAAAKPESVLTFELSSVAIRTIAHYIKASVQILADAPALRSYIDTRLTYGVQLREETQLVAGDGTGQNISGMTASGNYTAFTPETGDTAIDSLNRAKYAIAASDWVADGIVMNPADWGDIERLKTTEGMYIVGNPFGTITPVMWGLPVAVTNSMTENYFLMADFMTSYERILRQAVVIDVGYENDDFTKNLVTIRAEMRSALATIRPASTRYGALVS